MNTELQSFVEMVAKKSSESDQPIIISVSGGSCSGKSTLVDELTASFENVQIIHQDNYQLGSNFARRKESKYKWDDPENFQLEKCADDMKKLLTEKSVVTPVFDLKQNVSTSTQVLQIKKINILDGIYASLPPLSAIATYSLYIETPYYVRFLRRIWRFIKHQQSEDLTTPLRHMATFVLAAHRDFVVHQKRTAALVIQGGKNVPVFPELKNLVLPSGKYQLIFENETFSILIYNKEKKVVVKQNDKPVYFETVTDEIINALIQIDWTEL